MAQSLYARAAGRGFPAIDFGGQTGQGQLASYGGGLLSWQDHAGDMADHGPTPPTTGYNLAAGATRLYDPAQLGDTGLDWVNDAPLWGLPAGTRPDQLPRTETGDAAPQGPGTPHSGTQLFGQLAGGVTVPTHAAPMPNLPMTSQQLNEYLEEENDIHGVNFGGHAQRNDIPFLTQIPGWSHLPVNDGGTTELQPLDGPIRAQGGLDAVQGYGGGGPGPGGVNDAHQWGYWQDQAEYPVDLTPVIVNAGEVPFITELPQMFTATDQTTIGQPITYGYSRPETTMIPQAPYEPPLIAPDQPLADTQPAYAASFW